MPATKKAGYIEISGTSNTLSTLYSDINDVNYISRSVDVDDTYIYTMNSANCDYLTILDGGELTIGNPDDYSFREQFRTSYSSNNAGGVNIEYGGILKVYGNSSYYNGYGIDTTAKYAKTTNIYGSIIVQGDDTYRPLFVTGRNCPIIISNICDGELREEIKRFYKCDMMAHYDSYMFQIYINNARRIDEWTFEDVEFIHNLRSGTLYCIHSSINYQINSYNWNQFEFKNLKIKSGYENSGLLIGNYFSFKLTDTNWNTTYNNYQIQIGGNITLFPYVSFNSNMINDFPATEMVYRYIGQKIIAYLDNCDVSYSTPYSYWGTVNNNCLCKDCTNSNSKNANLNGTSSTLYCWNSDDIFNNIYITSTSTLGDGKKVFLLDLTIQDENGSPINMASIDIFQKDNKEQYLLKSNVNGKIIAGWDLDGVLLANQIYRKDLSGTPTVETVSDSSNNTYHTVTVSKEGYKTETFNVVMDEDKTMTVTLKTARAYDSILVDTEEETYINNDESIYYCINSPIKYATTPDVNIKYKKCYLLNLTVEDENGSIENALVDIESGSDDYSFETNSDGKIDTFFNIIGGGVYLTNRHKTSTGEFITSDNSNNTYHIIKVLKEGYEQSFTKVVMDSDKDITIVLKAMEVPKEDIEVEMSTSKLNKVVQGRLLHSVVVSEEVVHIPTPEPEPDPVPTAVIRTTRLTGRIK